MHRSSVEPCVIIKRNDNALEGLIIIQVDDSFCVGFKYVMDTEESSVEYFKPTPRF